MCSVIEVVGEPFGVIGLVRGVFRVWRSITV
jgi:hypothetical protein